MNDNKDELDVFERYNPISDRPKQDPLKPLKIRFKKTITPVVTHFRKLMKIYL